MSAIGITAPGTTRLPVTRLRLTARGRRVFAALAALPAVVVLSVAIIGGGAALASREPGASVESFSYVTASSGDSLWSIAEQVAPAADPRDVVDAIIKLNALDTAVIEAGQRLAIPTEYASGR